jgi:hypothetical protein
LWQFFPTAHPSRSRIIWINNHPQLFGMTEGDPVAVVPGLLPEVDAVLETAYIYFLRDGVDQREENL